MAALTHPTGSREWTIGGRSIPVVPPRLRDPRIHVAAVTLSVHVLGQVWLGFRLSLTQIALALLTGVVIDLTVTYVRTGALVWPGSALLTASGIALILRVPGTEHGDWWSMHGWYWFVGTTVVGMATKHLIRRHGSHVFNPSNVALVAVFVLAGSSRVEPLDFWWGPMGWAMVAAYAVIVVGGLTVGRRLALNRMAVAFWLTFAAGMAVLAASGHSITARWSFTPIEDFHFWCVVVTSPEVLIFLFFMITDPRTVPSGRVARVAFAVAIGVLCTLLIAPQTTEFGAKVGLLAGLVIMCVLRPVFDRWFPTRGSANDALPLFARGLLVGSEPTPWRTARAVAATLTGVVVFAAVVVAAGIPARPAGASPIDAPPVRFEALDLDALPEIIIDPKVGGFGADLETPEGARDLVDTLAGNLSVEGEAVLRGDPNLLFTVDHGDHLERMRQAVAASIESGRRTVSRYSFDSLHLTVVFPQGAQAGANAGVVATGTVEHVTYGPGDEVVESVVEPLDVTFTLRPIYLGRWLTTDVLSSD